MSADDDARRAVMRTLRSVPESVNFSIHSFNVTPARLQAVGRAVCQGQIQVRYRPNQGNIARYHSDSDVLALPFRHSADWFCKAQIIHEATHAAADMVRANRMCIQTSEASAHIAQSLYMIRYTGRSPRRLTSGNAADDRVFETAWAAAIGVLDRDPHLYGLMEAVRTAVSGHSRYGTIARDEPRAYNGLSRPPARQCTSSGQ